MTDVPGDGVAPTAPRRKRRWPWIVGVVAVLVVAGAAVGLYLFFRDDAPAEVSLEAAVEAAQGAATTETPAETSAAPDTTTAPADTTAPTDAASTTTAAGGGGVEGTWIVDTSIGTFDFESATGSFAGFRVAEELASIGSTTAVGRTGDVSGSITIEGTTLTAADIEVDLTTITTNESRRDNRVQGALDTDQFPTATFTLTAPVELGEAASTGGPLSVSAPGELTIHGITRAVEFPLEAQRTGDVVAVVGSLDIVFADYGVSVPSAPIVLSVEDQGVVELQLLFTRQ